MVWPILLCTDCEGPLALNDNAFELCREFLKPDGDKFFKQVSCYDDYLADVEKRPGYKAGDTLKLVLPFLRATGLSNHKLGNFSRKTIALVPAAEKACRFLRQVVENIFMVSTSYSPYCEAVGRKLGIPRKDIFSTVLDLSKYHVCACEAKELRRLQGLIVGEPDIELPESAKSIFDLPEASQATIRLLDAIFFRVIPAMEIGRAIYGEVDPVGGSAKAQAVQEAAARTGISLKNTIYVGDSITDVQAFEIVRAGGGISVSFNGNHYAVNSAEVIVAADTAWATAAIVCVFAKWGRSGVLEFANMGKYGKVNSLAHLRLCSEWKKNLEEGLAGKEFSIFLADACDMEKAAAESAGMRSKLRGEAIAALG